MHKNQSTLAAAVAIIATSFLSASEDTSCFLEGSYHYASASDLGDGSGNTLERRTTTASLGFSRSIGPEGTLSMALDWGQTEFDFGSEKRWDAVDQLAANVRYEQGLGGRWNLLGLARVASSVESGAAFEDGFTWGLALGGRYRASESLSWIVGIAYLDRLEDDALVLPLVGVEWQINDHFRLNSLIGLELSYDVRGDGASVLSFGVDYQLEDFRLEQRSTNAAEAAVRPEGVGLYLAYSQRLYGGLSMLLRANYVGEQEFVTLANSQEVDRFSLEDSVVCSLGLRLAY